MGLGALGGLRVSTFMHWIQSVSWSLFFLFFIFVIYPILPQVYFWLRKNCCSRSPLFSWRRLVCQLETSERCKIYMGKGKISIDPFFFLIALMINLIFSSSITLAFQFMATQLQNGNSMISSIIPKNQSRSSWAPIQDIRVISCMKFSYSILF